MRIVRTIGQAFEVCHKKSLQKEQQIEEANEAGSEKSSEETEPKVVQKSMYQWFLLGWFKF